MAHDFLNPTTPYTQGAIFNLQSLSTTETVLEVFGLIRADISFFSASKY